MQRMNSYNHTQPTEKEATENLIMKLTVGTNYNNWPIHINNNDKDIIKKIGRNDSFAVDVFGADKLKATKSNKESTIKIDSRGLN